MVNEILLKCILHNICRDVHLTYRRGQTPPTDYNPNVTFNHPVPLKWFPGED